MLFYDYVEDIAERRAPYREQHLARIAAEKEAGRIVLAGAVGEPPRGAAIAFFGVSPKEVEAFAREDPYVTAGLVREWRVDPLRIV